MKFYFFKIEGKKVRTLHSTFTTRANKRSHHIANSDVFVDVIFEDNVNMFLFENSWSFQISSVQ